MCEDTNSFGHSHRTSPKLITDTVKIKYLRCHVNLPVESTEVGQYSDSYSSNYKSSVTECPTCDFDLTTGQQVGKWGDDLDLRSGSVTEGLMELIAQSLSRNESEDLCKSLTNLQNLKITIEYALCSPCNHVSQRGSYGYEWTVITRACHSMGEVGFDL